MQIVDFYMKIFILSQLIHLKMKLYKMKNDNVVTYKKENSPPL